MHRTNLLHTRWYALGLITAIALGGCSTIGGDTGEASRTRQADTVATTPINISLTLPAGVNSSSILLDASNRLTLNGAGTVGDASRLTTIAGLGNGTQLLIQAGARIFGNVFSGSAVTLSSSATIYGSAQSGRNIDIQPGAQIIGTVTRNSAPAQVGLSWVVDWPTSAGTPVVREARNGTLAPGAPGEAIVPGHYSDFNVKSRNRMTFSTGKYFIESFNLEPDAEVMIDSTSGPVIVYVKNSFRYQGKFLPVRDSAGLPKVREGALRVAYVGSNAAEITGPFVGVLIAPNADLNLNSPNSGQHKGAFFAKNITVSANGNSSLLPLDYDLNDFTRGTVDYGDADDDRTKDDKDLCPTDPKKVEPGVCGCNVPDTDANGDRIPDCVGTVGEFCKGKTAGTECYSTVCPNDKVKKTCNASGVCGDPASECAPGGGGTSSGCYYAIFRTSIYWVCNKSVTWQAAAAMCREVPGRNLVHIDGRTENAWLDSVATSGMWIGANTAGSGGSWSWTQGSDNGAFPFWTAGGPTGSSIDGRFTHWQATQPSGGGCGSIQADGTWVAESCTSTHGFICEQPLNVAPPTNTNDICQFYPGADCKDSSIPSTCVPATDLMAGSLADFADGTNKCNTNCTSPELVGTSACTDNCKGILPIPVDGDTCSRPVGVAAPVCDIEQTGFGATCNPAAPACGTGLACGRVYQCAALSGGAVIPCKQNGDCSTNVCDPTHKVCIDPAIKLTPGADRSYDANKCFASYHCGTPVEDSCDTKYFTFGADPCNEVEICNPDVATSDHINPLDAANGSNLGKTPFDPNTAFKKPDPAVATPYGDAKPAGCGGPGEAACALGVDHPWCKPQVNSADNTIKSQVVTDQGSTDDKKGRSGAGGNLTVDFDPNLSLDYNVDPSLFGDSTFFADAKASATASVKLTSFLGFTTPDISILDALGEIRVDRCGLQVDAHTRLLGLDFLPVIMGDSYDELHKFDTDPTARAKCQQGIADFQREVARVAKSLRDAQELIRQYQEAVTNNTILDSSFCSQVISGFVPWDFPALNCSTAKPDEVVNAFIDYYAQQAISLAGKGIDKLSLPSFGSGQLYGEVQLAGKEGRENQNLLNLPFTIGPIPMSLTVDAYLTYGVSGGLQFGLTPDGFLQTFKNRDPAELAYARANATPHAGAGIEMFVGAGFDCGFAAAKIGVSGDVNIADVDVPLTAGAYLNVRSEGEDRPLPTDLLAANNGSATYEVYFPPVGPSRFRFGAGYEYNARVDITDILDGTINAQLKLKFLFFSKTWRAKIAEFKGLKDQHFQLFSGKGGIDGAIDLSGVDLGAVSMPVPFLKLPHVAPAPSSVTTKVAFDPNRVEHLFYDNQCAVRVAKECPRIFADVPSSSSWLDAENSNFLAAYGTNGFTVGNNVYMWSDYQSWTNFNGDMAIGTLASTGSFGTNDHLGVVFGGKSVTYPKSSYPSGKGPYVAYYPGEGTILSRAVPAIALNTPFPAELNRPQFVSVVPGAPVHYLPGDYAGEVTVRNGGTLSLDGSGQYFFNKLTVEAGGVIIINHSSGAVEVSVKDAISWQGQIVNGNGRENAHVVSYYGSSPVTLNSVYGFNGTFVAKNASVTVTPAYYHGAVYAKSLNVQTGAYFAFHPCHLWVPQPPTDIIR